MYDLKQFRTKIYELEYEKLPEGKPIRFALLADLHGVEGAEYYSVLHDTIQNEKPDAILLAGDMLCRKKLETAFRAVPFLKTLAAGYPVFYGMGNHETWNLERRMPWYLNYERTLQEAGVVFLHNSYQDLFVNGIALRVYGLELPQKYYRKPFPPRPEDSLLTEWIGDANPATFNLLIAHHPLFAGEYFDWGADLTVCGHYHGGVLRFSEHVGAVSPLVHPFPRYCCGDFKKGNQYLVVSPGLGEHSMPLRIHNPRELIFLDLTGKKKR